jgi:hypothetical protein
MSTVTAEEALTQLRGEVERKLDAVKKERAAMEAIEAKGVRLPTPLMQTIVDYLYTRPYGEVFQIIYSIRSAAEHRDVTLARDKPSAE